MVMRKVGGWVCFAQGMGSQKQIGTVVARDKSVLFIRSCILSYLLAPSMPTMPP